jgi:hypothetical protein
MGKLRNLINPPAYSRAGAVPRFDLGLVTMWIADGAGEQQRVRMAPTFAPTGQDLVDFDPIVFSGPKRELQRLEDAMAWLGAEIVFMPIRKADRDELAARHTRTAAVSAARLAAAVDTAELADEIISGRRATGSVEVDAELQRIVTAGREVLRRCLDRDHRMVELYYSAGTTAPGAMQQERNRDRQRLAELRDEYELMNGGYPQLWPF